MKNCLQAQHYEQTARKGNASALLCLKTLFSINRCAVISHPAPGSTNTYDCKGTEGRYVNIVIPRKKEYLSLCEVKVTGEPSGKSAAAAGEYFFKYFILLFSQNTLVKGCSFSFFLKILVSKSFSFIAQKLILPREE